jgi:hypothetical protein
MRQIQKRLQKLKEAIRPDDNSFTFMELYRWLWVQDKRHFQEMADGEFPMLRLAIAQFEADELEAERTRDRNR